MRSLILSIRKFPLNYFETLSSSSITRDEKEETEIKIKRSCLLSEQLV